MLITVLFYVEKYRSLIMDDITVGRLIKNRFDRPVAFTTPTAGAKNIRLSQNASVCPATGAINFAIASRQDRISRIFDRPL